ncbi:MAG: DGQHR domain-containing protein [Candidatus Thiodiazotropha sp.]
MAGDNYISERVIFVDQPFGGFYVASIKASKLVKVAYSLPAKYGEESLDGVQRGINQKRVDNIARFCKTENAMFPSSIILAANLLEDGSAVDPAFEWKISADGYLNVPKEFEAASIVDGQHRLEGLKKALNEGCEDFDILCSIYMDLPAPKQAEVFATINFNHQKVDKSLAYQLFGYDLDATDPKYWSPDTLAISFARILNKNPSSPFKNHISYGMKEKHLSFSDEQEEADYKSDPWKVSTSTMVEGIVRLISSNPTEDRYELHKKRMIRKDRAILEEVRRRSSEPLRHLYLSYNDGQFYDMVENYFRAVKRTLWIGEGMPLLRKTIGIQAIFDLLKRICEDYDSAVEWQENSFKDLLEKVDLKKIGDLETNYSGVGRSQIRNVLLEALQPVE